MAFCKNCGTKFEEDVKFCPSCGTSKEETNETSKEANDSAEKVNENPAQKKVQETVDYVTNTVDSTDGFSEDDIKNNKAMAVLSYIWVLVFIPLFAEPKSKFVRFHANQGLVLLVANIAYVIMVYAILQPVIITIFTVISYGLIGIIWRILNIGYFVFAVLQVIGIINAATGKAKELPIFGKIKLLK